MLAHEHEQAPAVYRLRNAVLLASALGLLGAGLWLTELGLALEEQFGLRWMFSVRGAVEPPQEVLVVSADRRSAADAVHGLDELLVRPVGLFLLKGKEHPVNAFQICAERESCSAAQQALCERFAEALHEFDEERWARAGFQAILGEYPGDGPSMYYRNLCARYEHSPPQHGRRNVIRIDTK